MGDKLVLIIGILGNVASFLLYAAPILTFSRIIRNKSTEQFSCIPYALALWNAIMYMWYGLPVVSHNWENIPLVTIAGLGIILELSFILLYFWFSTAKGKKKVVIIITPIILASTASVFISAYVFHDHHRRKIFVGCVTVAASVAMYISPLVVVKEVIKTKSVEFMPFYLSFSSFIASVLWMAYGLLSHDLFIASPNMVGAPLGLGQLVLYFKYMKKEVMERPESCV